MVVCPYEGRAASWCVCVCVFGLMGRVGAVDVLCVLDVTGIVLAWLSRHGGVVVPLLWRGGVY